MLPATHRPARILVVEDDPANAMLMCELLDRWGHATTCVDNGLQAVGEATSQTFDIVLMDLRLPLLDGAEATRRIRGWESAHRRPRMPIIAVTACAMPGERKRCVRAGMDEVLIKPYRLTDLNGLLARWLESRHHLGTAA